MGVSHRHCSVTLIGRQFLEMTEATNRVEKRFSICKGQTLSAWFLAAGSGEPGTAEVVDISPSGARMTIPAPVKTDQRITLQLSVADAGVDVQIEAVVCWVRLGREYRWLSGILFTESLDVGLLEKLASAGYIEQRSAPRTDILVSAQARRETFVEDLHVEITNLSETGFRFSSPQVMTPGDRVLVDAESEGREVAIPAYVRWSGASEDDCFSAGCEFVDTSSFQYLKQHIAGKRSKSLVQVDRGSLHFS